MPPIRPRTMMLSFFFVPTVISFDTILPKWLILPSNGRDGDGSTIPRCVFSPPEKIAYYFTVNFTYYHVVFLCPVLIIDPSSQLTYSLIVVANLGRVSTLLDDPARLCAYTEGTVYLQMAPLRVEGPFNPTMVMRGGGERGGGAPFAAQHVAGVDRRVTVVDLLNNNLKKELTLPWSQVGVPQCGRKPSLPCGNRQGLSFHVNHPCFGWDAGFPFVCRARSCSSCVIAFAVLLTFAELIRDAPGRREEVTSGSSPPLPLPFPLASFFRVSFKSLRRGLLLHSCCNSTSESCRINGFMYFPHQPSLSIYKVQDGGSHALRQTNRPVDHSYGSQRAKNEAPQSTSTVHRVLRSSVCRQYVSDWLAGHMP